MPEALLADAAQALGVSTDTLRRRVKSKAIPSRRDDRGRIWVALADAYAPPPADLATLQARLGEAETQLGQALARIATLEGDLARARDHAATLQRERDSLEAERDWLRALSETLTARVPLALPAPSRPWWAIWRTQG